MKTLIIAVVLMCACTVSAKEIGKVVKTVGKVVRMNKEHKLNDVLKAGTKVYRFDEIQTAKSSFIKILLNDDTIFQLGGNSKFKFEKYNSKQGKKKRATYRLLYGKMRSLFIKQQSADVMITTPTVSMGIRGTEVLTDVFWDKDDFKATTPKTEVALLSGKLELNIGELTKEGLSTMELNSGEVFDSSKALQPKLRSLSVQKMPKAIFKKLKTGKAIFLFEAKHPQIAFPDKMPIMGSDPQKASPPPMDPKKAIIEGKKKHVRKHFMRKDPQAAPPPHLQVHPPTDSTNHEGSVTDPPPYND